MTLSILHVDDSEDIREVVRLALETVGGLNVVQCGSGAEALEAAQASKIDLFLLDVMMPEMTGPQTLLGLRELPQFARTPAVFLTAKAANGDLDELMGLGAADVLFKPFDPMTLADQVVAIWERSQADV